MLKTNQSNGLVLNVIHIAASNSTPEAQSLADVVCTGKNDERILKQAIDGLKTGGTIQLLDGDYFIDSFESEGNSAIFFGYNDGQARVVNIVGCTENKSYNTNFGVKIHVTEQAMKAMSPNSVYRVFYGTEQRPDAPGDFYTMTHVNNVNFDNFYIYLHDASKQVRVLDCSNFGSAHIRQIGIYTEHYFEDRFLHLKPATSVKGCIGVITVPSSNDEMARIGCDTVNVGGLHTGFLLNGVDHLIMQTCTTARCCYGYIFFHQYKTLTMLNCCDEGNTHLPRFSGEGHLSCIDFNIERFNAAYIPDDPDGDSEPHAMEETIGNWHGFISYTLQGKAFDLHKLWKDGHGINFTTVNLMHDRTRRPQYPEFLEQYFDTALNQMLTWNGSCWINPLGTPVE